MFYFPSFKGKPGESRGRKASGLWMTDSGVAEDSLVLSA
jgi:hypothetical protein